MHQQFAAVCPTPLAKRARSPLTYTEPTCSAGAVSLVENLKKSLCAFAPVTGAIDIGTMPLPAPGAGAKVRNFGFAGSTSWRQ